MKFLQVLKKRKILFLNVFLFLYIALNLFTGERGIFSYLEKKDLEVKLTEKKDSLKKEILEMENKNLLLSDNLDYDFIDTLIREKLKFGKKEEVIIKIK
tara:strand:- start:677 stop:973 length:297 start_codon:yes stop_codon:yes gene_type:complete